MKGLITGCVGLLLVAGAAGDVRVFVTKADGTVGEWGLDLPEYHLACPQGETFWGPNQQGGGWTIDAITRCEFGYSLFPNRYGTVPPKDLDTSGRVEIDSRLGEWGYVWLQFGRDAFGNYRPDTMGTVKGLVITFEPQGGAQFQCLSTLFYNPNNAFMKRWDGTTEMFVNQNPTGLIAIMAQGIEFGPDCTAWNLYYGPDQVKTTLLGAIDCVNCVGVQEFDLVVSEIVLAGMVQVQGPLHPAKVRFIGTLVGDMNCDGSINFADINPFVLALTNPAAYQAQYPNCYVKNADINRDTRVDFGDINPFIKRLLQQP